MTSFYDTLMSTAEKFVHMTDFTPSDNGPNESKIRALCADNYQQSWGHDYFISSKPHLNHTLDLNGFIGHLSTMSSKMTSADAEVTDMSVDERQRKVVVRATYKLLPKGCPEPGVNDLVWILKLSEDGRKVESGKEFIDGEAAMRLGQLIRESNGVPN
jgi:hypothetical protein